MPRPTPTLILALATLLLSVAAAQPTPEPAEVPYLDTLRDQAAALAPTAQTDAVREFLAATSRLTTLTPRNLWTRTDPPATLTEAQYQALPEAEHAGFTARALTDNRYYQTNFGTPLCYARCLDIAADAAALPSFHNTRILDYGYGQIGQLRLLAACGADAVGVDPAPGLALRYSLPQDQGPYPPDPQGGPQGAVTLVHGFWPGDEATASAVGGGYDIILARNVLKHGYVNPVAEVDPRTQIDLSVPDEQYLAAILSALNPGGVWVIYNLGGPRLRAGAYDASADINCPWTRETLEAAGFEVLAFDMDDSGPTREHAVAFGWAQPTDPLGSQWFSLYTVCRKPH